MLPDEIRTDRLVLRPFEFSDAPDVLAYANNEEWARFMPVPSPYTLRDAEEFLARFKLTERARHPSWAITFKDRVIGGIDISFAADHRFGELGYSIGREHWNHGHATEAARAIVDEAFSHISGLTRIRSHADVRNIGSIRVMQKVGMKLDGCLRSNRVMRDEIVDDEYYSILRQEWNAERGRKSPSL